jgi:hypothetical protein
MDSVSRELETAGRNALARQLWRETQNLQNHVESSGAAQGVVGGGTGGRRELDAAEQAIAASVTASEDDADLELDSARKRGSGCMDIEGGRMWRTERRIADYLALVSPKGGNWREQTRLIVCNAFLSAVYHFQPFRTLSAVHRSSHGSCRLGLQHLARQSHTTRANRWSPSRLSLGCSRSDVFARGTRTLETSREVVWNRGIRSKSRESDQPR